MKHYAALVTLKTEGVNKKYGYDPRPDITAYELALILPIISSFSVLGHTAQSIIKMIEYLPDEAKRHWIVEGE